MVDGRVVPAHHEAELLILDSWNNTLYPQTTALFDHLLNKCNFAPRYFPFTNWTPGVWGEQTKVAIRYYQIRSGEGTNMALRLEYLLAPTLLWDYVTTEIDNGLPAMITTPPANMPKYNAHTMLVCGYDNTNGQREFEVHNGWYGPNNISASPPYFHSTDYISANQPTMAYRLRMAAGWHTDNQGNKRYLDDDNAAKTGWQTIDTKKYYFDTNGVLQFGLQTINGKTYYFENSGAMLAGLQVISGYRYYFGTNGSMTFGWQNVNNSWHYFRPAANNPSTGPKGTAVMGFQTIEGKTYYFGTDGVMLTGFQTISGKIYYFGTDGAMLTGFQTIEGKTYYFNSSGVMLTDLQYISGRWQSL
jgi:YHS domain-containing protein